VGNAEAMNSSQRRKLKREYPVHVTLERLPNESWFLYSDRLDEAQSWCNKNKVIYTTKRKHNGFWVFRFNKSQDAVFFKLKFYE
jgi:hypothetical protein